MNAEQTTTNTLTLQQALNKTVQVFAIQLENFLNSAIQTASYIYIELAELKSPIEFTHLQWTLLKVLLWLLLGTGILIFYAWHVYGKVITEKFVRLSTVKEIEELKLSVAKLKLPKEHSPRI